MDDIDFLVKNFDFQDESFQSFLRLIPAAVAVLDKEVKYIAVSDRWYSDYGLKNRDIIGKSHYEIFPEILNMPEWLAYHQSSLKGSIHEKAEDCFAREDGSLQWIRWKIYPWYTSSDEIGGMIFYTEVITDSKDKQLSLEKANNLLHQKNKQLEEFAYITAHNLKAPATNLTALASFYSESEDNAERNHVIEQILISSQNLTETLDTLQEALLIKTNSSLEKEKVNLSETIKKIINEKSQVINETKTHITIDLVDMDEVYTSKSYLESILINLVNLAINFRSPNRIPEVKIGSFLTENQICIEVQDNGIGFDMDKYGSKVFEIGNIFTNDLKSQGMAFYLMKHQIDALEGELVINSIINKGTNYIVKLNL